MLASAKTMHHSISPKLLAFMSVYYHQYILLTLQLVCHDNMLGCCVDSSYDLAQLCVQLYDESLHVAIQLCV